MASCPSSPTLYTHARQLVCVCCAGQPTVTSLAAMPQCTHSFQRTVAALQLELQLEPELEQEQELEHGTHVQPWRRQPR